MDTYTIDFTECKYIHDVHQAIKIGLEFPDYYGENWSAFWDCLTDFPNEGFMIIILGFDNLLEKFPDTTEKILTCLEDYKCVINKKVIVNVFFGDDEHQLF